MEIIQKDSQTWIFDEGGVRFFLLTGTEKALLIDSGMETRNAKEQAGSLTDLPISLLNTHVDMDHIGSMGQFDKPYTHPSECKQYYDFGGTQEITPIWDDDVLDLGERPLEIIHLPGHTPGSIGILDRKNRRLISGDPIQDDAIFMFGPSRDLHSYIHSLRRLEGRFSEIDEIWPSHGTLPVGKDLVGKLITAAEEILAGKHEGVSEELFGHKVRRINLGFATILVDEKD